VERTDIDEAGGEQNQKAVKGWREQTHEAEWREPNAK
jgi:hypothetical protein